MITISILGAVSIGFVILFVGFVFGLMFGGLNRTRADCDDQEGMRG